MLGEAQVLQVGTGDARHQRVSMQPGPGPSLEVIAAEVFLELLVGLLADPARLDRAGQGAARRLGRKRRTNRGALPAHLPRIETLVDVDSTVYHAARVLPCVEAVPHGRPAREMRPSEAARNHAKLGLGCKADQPGAAVARRRIVVVGALDLIVDVMNLSPQMDQRLRS